MRDSESVSFCSAGKSSVLNKHIIITDTLTRDRVSQVIYCLADLILSSDFHTQLQSGWV